MSWTRKKGDFLEHYFTNNDNLKSELREIKYSFKDYSFSYVSDNGVFSKNKVDYGSSLLIKTIINNTNKDNLNILDVGCGYGFIGICLSKILNSHTDMIDINKRAIHLAEINIKNNKVDSYAFLSNVYENVTNKYDLIVSNPPIRAGKEVVLEILLKAQDYLKDNGVLWFVIRKDQGVKSINKILMDSYLIEVVSKDKGYYIVKAQRKI